MASWQQSLSYAINLTNQIQVSIPFVLQDKAYTFTEVETGVEYTAPSGYEGLFHSEQTVFGLGDVNISGQHYVFLPQVVIGLDVGLRLPTGSKKYNEYSLIEYHQPLGTGTVVPTSRVVLFTRGVKQGVLSNVYSQIPFKENSEGYRFGSSIGSDIGYWRRYKEKTVVLGQISFLHENAHQWYSATIPYSNRSFLRTSLMSTYKINDSLEGMLRLETQLYRWIWGSDALEMKVATTPIINMGLTWL